MKKIKYLVMDVDGTLTDGKIYIGNDGELFKAFNVKDGCGIHDLAIPKGIIPIIITGRSSRIIENRCKELEITELYQGVENKITKLKSIVKEIGEVAYIGDDINDLQCMEEVKIAGGIVGCPLDANDKIKVIANFVSKYEGGNGAVREFIEYILD